MEQDELNQNPEENKSVVKTKKGWFTLFVIIILLVAGGYVIFDKYKILDINKISGITKPEQRTSAILRIDFAEAQKVDTSQWRDFVYEYFGYKLKVPNDVMVGGSTAYNDPSNLRKGENKHNLSFSKSDWYYVYFFPEGGFNYANKQLNSTSTKTYSSSMQSKQVTVKQYDEENVHIYFDNYHNFAIRIFVSKTHKDYWPVVEKILQLADLTDNIPSVTTSTKMNTSTKK